MTIRISVLLLLVGTSTCFGQAGAAGPSRLRGQTLVADLCAECHAVGAGESSPHVGAPAFRTLDRGLDLDSFVERLRRGLTSGHPDMPTYRFTRRDARAVASYLRSIRAP